jgi:hypothetical protein
MEWNVMWAAWEGSGLEHMRLRDTPDGPLVDSIVLGLEDEQPFRIDYEIHCDRIWKVRRCALHLLGTHAQEVDLRTDGHGHWTDASGNHLPTLDGCIDVDISATPFTNTLPIRCLALHAGQSADLLVAYIAVPEMQVQPMRQRYTCLESRDDGGLYRYESVDSGYVADLPVDERGLVIDYPGLWKRQWDDFSK